MKIIFLFDKENFEDSYSNYIEEYKEMFDAIGHSSFMVCLNENDNKIEKCYHYDDKDLVESFDYNHKGELIPEFEDVYSLLNGSIVINRRHKPFYSNYPYRIINDPDIVSICNDKALTYKLIEGEKNETPYLKVPEFQVVSSDIRGQSFDHDELIVKPNKGRIGKGVRKIRSEDVVDLMNRGQIEDGELLQEPIYTLGQYIDPHVSSIRDKCCDIRVIAINSTIHNIIIRTAKKGEFRSNLHTGGNSMILKKNHPLYKDLEPVVFSINNILSKITDEDKILGIDLGKKDEGKEFYLYELNSYPGISSSITREAISGFINSIALCKERE